MSQSSGFNEYDLNGQVLEREILHNFRKTAASHGFIEINTNIAQKTETLLKKGETSKEIYLLERLQKYTENANAPESSSKLPKLGLRFDHTVPLSNYILSQREKLTFPFKVMQIGDVFRGERAQKGRYREFKQADLDIVCKNYLPPQFETELPALMLEALAKFSKLGLPKCQVSINDRRLMGVFAETLDLENIEVLLQIIDKRDKITPTDSVNLLREKVTTDVSKIDAIMAFTSIQAFSKADFVAQIETIMEKYPVLKSEELIAQSDLLGSKLEDIQILLQLIPDSEHKVAIDTKIARGLDYYTGIVFETYIIENASFGSICSGGMYEKLTQDKKNIYPGIGFSIGITRLISYLLDPKNENLILPKIPISPAKILISVRTDEERKYSNYIASIFRKRGIFAEVYPSADRFGSQIKYAEKLGIKYIWFFGDGNEDIPIDASNEIDISAGSIKNLETFTQFPANANEIGLD